MYGKALFQIHNYLKVETSVLNPTKPPQIVLNKVNNPKTEVTIKPKLIPVKKYVSCYGPLPEPPEECHCTVLTSDAHLRHIWVAEEWKKYEALHPPPKYPSRCKYVFPITEGDEHPETSLKCDCVVLTSKTHINHSKKEEEMKNKRRIAYQKRVAVKKKLASKSKLAEAKKLLAK